MRMASPCAACRFATCKFPNLKKKFLGPPPLPNPGDAPVYHMLKTKYQRVLVSFLELENFSLKKRSRISIMPLLLMPYLLYCVEIWGNAAECHILPIITLQKKIIRFITFSPYLAHTKNLFLDTNILPFKKWVIHRIGIQMFKFNLGLSPVALNNLFVRNSNIHNYNTRNKNKLRSAI